MADHNGQQLSAREMVRAHTYPVLAAVASFSLLALALLQIPQAVKTHRYNRCVDAQVSLRSTSNCLLYTSPSPRDATLSRMPSSA